MRTIGDIEAAKAKLKGVQTEEAIRSLPPGYILGFRLRCDGTQLVVGKGVMNCRGSAVYHTVEDVIDGNDFVLPQYILKNITYYVYMNKSKEYKVDSIDAVWDDDSLGYYHPVLFQYRYLGRGFLNTNGTWTNILNQDPVLGEDVNTDSLKANEIISRSITATELETLFLIATIIYVGYSGTGSVSAPVEGDKVLYLSGVSIEFREYTGGFWVTTNGAKLGGLSGTNFLPFLAARGMYHPNNPITTTEYFPHTYFRVFNFEADYKDQKGVDDWIAKTNCAFNGTTYKFGVYALGVTAGNYGDLVGPATATMGSNQAIGFWFHPTIANGENDAQTNFLFAQLTYSNDSMAFYITKLANSNSCKLSIRVLKSGVEKLFYTLDYLIGNGAWNYASFAHNASTDKIRVSLNNNPYYESGVLGGTWTGGAGYLWLNPYNAYVAGGFTTTIIYDELIYAYNYNTDINYFIQHYTHNAAWSTAYGKADLLHQPDTNGVDVFIKGMRSVGPAQFDSTINCNGNMKAATINSDGAVAITGTCTATTFIGAFSGIPTLSYIQNPTTNWLASKTTGWTNDNFAGGLTVDFSDSVPANTKRVIIAYKLGATAGGAGQALFYWRKNDDIDISNTPNASNEFANLGGSVNYGTSITYSFGILVIWLSAGLKAQFAHVGGVTKELYISRPMEALV